MAFTFIPSQHQFLLVRRAGENPEPLHLAEDLANLPANQVPTGPYYFAELYDIAYTPEGASVTCDAAARTAVHDAEWNFWHNVWITEPGMGAALKNEKGVPVELRPQNEVKKPLPITIFVQAHLSYGLVFNTFFPDPVPDLDTPADAEHHPGTRYVYVLSQDDPFIETEPLPKGMESLNDLYEHRILLGSTRPVIYTIPRQGAKPHSFQIRMLGGVWDEGLLDRPSAVRTADEDSQSDVFEGSGRIRVSHQFDLELADLDDVSAVAWDETIGRLCIGYTNSTRIAVFDFAGAPVPTIV